MVAMRDVEQAPTWLKTDDAAEYVGAASASTLRSWIARGLLRPDGRLGPRGSWLFRRSTLDAFLVRCAHPESEPTDERGSDA